MSATRKRHVLIVEDDPHIVDELQGLLMQQGFVVDIALNGRQALDILLASPNHEPALVLLDLGLPVMDGWELLAIMRSYYRFRTIPVVLVTAHRVDPDSRSVFDGVFHKPFRREDLLDKIEAICGQAA